EAQRGPAVLTVGDEALEELNDCGARIRFATRPGPKLHQRIRLLGTGREHAAGPVVLERAADDRHAGCQQGGCKRVSGAALVTTTVELKRQRLLSVDEPAVM